MGAWPKYIPSQERERRCDPLLLRSYRTNATVFICPAPGQIGVQMKEDYVLSHVTQAATDAADKRSAMTATSKSGSGNALLERIVSSLEEDKAEEIVKINLAGKSEMADHMVVCSGRSSRQVTGLAEKLADRLKHEFGIFCKIEGKDQGDWVLIDAGDVIVHVFRPEVREFYQLEKMWMNPGAAANVVTPSEA